MMNIISIDCMCGQFVMEWLIIAYFLNPCKSRGGLGENADMWPDIFLVFV
jgi:hypothetical protein